MDQKDQELFERIVFERDTRRSAIEKDLHQLVFSLVTRVGYLAEQLRLYDSNVKHQKNFFPEAKKQAREWAIDLAIFALALVKNLDSTEGQS